MPKVSLNAEKLFLRRLAALALLMPHLILFSKLRKSNREKTFPLASPFPPARSFKSVNSKSGGEIMGCTIEIFQISSPFPV
jgi:hypothetical protein